MLISAELSIKKFYNLRTRFGKATKQELTKLFLYLLFIFVQSTLVISTSVISNNRLSRRDNLIPVLT